MGRRNLHPEDDRGGREIQVSATGAGEITGVQEGLGDGFTGCTPPNPERRGKGVPGQEVDGEDKGGETREYKMVFTAKSVPRPCPV